VRRREKSLLVVASLILLAIGIVACGPAQDPQDEIATATARAEAGSGNNITASSQSSQTESVAVEEVPTEQASAPFSPLTTEFDIYAGLGESAFKTTESGLRYATVEKGDGGQRPESGQAVAVHFTGWLEDGTIIGSSVDSGQPVRFPLGQGFIMDGWDEGIALMEKGDKARFIIPGELAFGEAGYGAVPPNATLIFDIELVDISEGPPEAPVAVAAEDYVVTDSGLQYFDMVVGDGQPAEVGMAVFMDYTAWMADGSLLSSTILTGQPFQAILDGTQLYPGWEEGLLGMQAGGSRQLVIPPDLVYREAEIAAGAVPPADNLIIEIDLLDVFGPEQ
jgi:FKBP-type peptidyl-prolyl cis-trans isomerase